MESEGRAKQLFNEALERPEAERGPFLSEACAGDAALLARVRRLLAAHRRGSGFLASPTSGAEGDGASPRLAGERPGSLIGRYELLELIGEGGFGSVFMAEQREPVRRRVALKVIKLGMDTRQVIARFEAERQALAMMDHPGIARVLDAGATETGRPYFVMELVGGEPITEYCDRHRLTIPRRLELFREVCQAVQHAHQKGVIHRDIKPSNVLVAEVDGRPAPKIIDFGIAKATGGAEGLTDRTLFTDFRQFLGTPEYMSPEQAQMGSVDIDTRSDIYSLGVLLYELLAGAPPFDPRRLRSAAWDEMRRIIREDEPQRPSTRMHTLAATGNVAARRGVEPARLAGLVRGDLDWIVMKCLEKDRSRRYETASGVAMDIARHLSGEPVLAAPPSAVYRVRKFIRRHRGQAVAASLVTASLLAAVVGTGTFAAREARQRALAEQRADETDQVAGFQAQILRGIHVARMGAGLREDLLDQAMQEWRRAHPDEEEVDALRAGLEEGLAGVNFTTSALRSLDRDVFEPALAAIHEQFAGRPLVQARLMHDMGVTLRTLGLFHRAVSAQTDTIMIRRAHLGDEHPDTLSSIAELAAALTNMRRPDDAEPHAREALEGRRRVLGPDHLDTLQSVRLMGFVLRWQGRNAAAEPLLREALEGCRRVLGDDHEVTIGAMLALAQFLSFVAPDEAEPYVAEATERLYRAGDPRSLSAMAIALLRDNQGRFEEATRHYRQALDRSRAARGDDHRDTLNIEYRLGRALMQQGALTEAEGRLRRALDGQRQALGVGNVDTLESAALLAGVLDAMGRAEEATELRARSVREALDAFRTSAGEPPGLSDGFYAMLCKVSEGERVRQEFADLYRATYGPADPRTLDAMGSLARHLRQAGRAAEAEPLAREAVEGFRRSAIQDRRMVSALGALAAIVCELRGPVDALPLYEEQKARAREAVGDVGPRDPDASIGHAECLVMLGRFADAERELLECRAAARRRAVSAAAIRSLVKTYEAWNQADPGGGHAASAATWQARLPFEEAADSGASSGS